MLGTPASSLRAHSTLPPSLGDSLSSSGGEGRGEEAHTKQNSLDLRHCSRRTLSFFPSPLRRGEEESLAHGRSRKMRPRVFHPAAMSATCQSFSICLRPICAKVP